jgi:PadR family transcriptional regulator, regulatory protein PadR
MSPIEATSLYGTLALLILKTLDRDTLHGLDIARRIRARTEGVLDVEEGALYPALHRLEREGLLEADWGVSGKGRRAKFYGLTGKGRRRLDRERAEWIEHTRAVSRVLEVTWP